jgi:hypothetical protein
MTPELEVELRTTVASLRVKTSCQEVPSRLVDPGRVESETAQWIEMMRRALDGQLSPLTVCLDRPGLPDQRALS